jgi:hypothetical protein
MRLLALAETYDGGSRGNAVPIGRVELQTIRDRVLGSMLKGRTGSSMARRRGKRPRNAVQREALAQGREWPDTDHTPGRALAADRSGAVAVGGVSHQADLDRQLRAMGLRKLSARPRHRAHNEHAAEAFKEFPRPPGADGEPGAKIEICFKDEARIGQKSKLTRRWARRGTRPAPRATSARHRPISSVPSAPKRATARAWSCRCNSTTMALRENAVLLMDQAGWHNSAKLEVPDHITIVLLPSRSPELNPAENLWQFMRANWLSNRVFTSYDDIVVHRCGTSSLMDPGPSCPSACVIGPIGHDQGDLV